MDTGVWVLVALVLGGAPRRSAVRFRFHCVSGYAAAPWHQVGGTRAETVYLVFGGRWCTWVPACKLG